ncbi:MAG: GAF domain-containing protein [Candidatus Rokubacteria bacterium]|nr:GAF domain-containing protein [Candidatus Rokubacteria bacterium]
MAVHKLLPLFALALNLLLLGSALAGDRRNRRHYTFAAFAAALAVWNVGVFGLRGATDAQTALNWEYVVHVGVIPLPAIFCHYVLAFLGVERQRVSLAIAYTFAAVLLVVSPTAFFITGVRETAWGWVPVAGPLYAPFFVYFQSYLVIGLVLLVRSHRTVASSFRRNRTRLVIFGVVVSLAGGVVDFLRFILGWERLYPLGIPANAVMAMALGLAIVRYRLWDVGLVAKRVLLYGLVAFGLAPLAVGALYAASRLGMDPGFAPTATSGIVLLVVFAAALPLLRRAERAIERVMFAREHGVRETLTALSRDMAAILDLEHLGRALTDGLVERVPVMHATMYLREPGAAGRFVAAAQSVSPSVDVMAPGAAALDAKLVSWLGAVSRPLTLEELAEHAANEDNLRLVAEMEAGRVALFVPLFLDGELTAVLTIGEKVSTQVFEPAEIRLLEALMGQTAVALRNARLYQDLRLQMQALERTQQQLVQSAKLAAIGELAASIAHELNNPLTVILGHAQMLRMHAEDDSSQARKLEKVESEALRAAKITRGLLDFSRRREPKHEPVSVNALVPRALDLINSKLRGRTITVDTILEERAPMIHGDADQLTQVLINLAGNAIDAMGESGRLTVTTSSTEDGLELAVQDTGAGMDAEQVNRIFEPFYTTKPEGKGTGLGLSVTLGILKSHGGVIAVESAPGRGTTMRVRLPRNFTPEPAAVLA